MAPEMTTALAVLIPIVVAGLISLLTFRGTARKDALAQANHQIEKLSARIDSLQKDYEILWAQMQVERREWHEEREQLQVEMARLTVENECLRETLKQHGIDVPRAVECVP